MRNVLIRTSMIAGLMATTASVAAAQTAVALPNSSQTTTMTAEVSEQAQVLVPAGVTFNVTNVGAITTASAATVTVDNIVLSTATKQLKISLQASAAAFTPSVALAATWSAADVSWGAATFTNGTGALGTLSDVAYSEVGTCAADAASCGTTSLVFDLAPNSAVKRAGSHTLVMTWKFESIGS